MLLVLAIALIYAPSAVAQTSTEDPHEGSHIRAQPIQTSISIDGRLDEADWETAPSISGFRQLRPQEGASASQRTEVRVLYGEDALYVGATLYDDHPDRIRARLARRDQRNQADWFEVSIDSYLDRKTARTFAVNAAGVQRDGLIQGGGGGGPGGPLDTSWDAIWRSEVRLTSEGWTAELRIPYSELRFSEADQQQWGVQFRRRIPRNSEVVEWPLVPESDRRSSLVAQYGTLTDLRNLNAGRSLEIAPYTVGRIRTREDTDQPGTATVNPGYDVGADFEIGLSSNSTLNATINPDFGQVEADPAVLNLSAFETFFDEKRPFFVEGTDIFDFRLGRRANLFYTRRIGAEAPVLGALKLTGRGGGDLSYGIVGASTGDDFSPNRSYGAGRLRQDIGDYSRAGAIVTAFDGPARDGRRRSLAGGVDWDLRLDDNNYQVQGYLAGTHRRWSEGDTSPSTGLAANAQVGRVRGVWNYSAEFTVRDDIFDPNDLGQMRRNNFYEIGGSVNHQFNGGQPFGPFQNGSGFVAVNQSWSYVEQLNRGLGVFSRFGFFTENFREVSFGIDGSALFGGYDLFETRGLWPRARPRSVTGELSTGTDQRREWEIEAEGEITPRSDGGLEWAAGLEGEWNVGSRVKLSSELSFEAERGVREWASNETFVGGSGTAWAIGTESAPPENLGDGSLTTLESGQDRLGRILADVTPAEGNNAYYVPVYGARDTERLSLTLRSNVAVTRTLSFEFFGQLFGARGRYQNFQILSSRDEFDSFSAYPKRHDFANSSFLTNAVLRWEFRPGSELFVVWSQNRRLDESDPFFYNRRRTSPYDPSTTSRLTDAFSDFPQNAFIVKLRYVFY